MDAKDTGGPEQCGVCETPGLGRERGLGFQSSPGRRVDGILWAGGEKGVQDDSQA